MSDIQTTWDVIIAGGGPAGCSAAIVLARSNRKVLVIDEGKQRNLSSHGMHNFLTRDDILPTEFLKHTHAELEKYGVQFIHSRVLKAETLADTGFCIRTETGSFACRRLLIATGVTDNIPDVPGMRELWGRCVYHCPYCDGWECKDGVTGLYSKSISGYGMAIALNHLVKDVVIFTDGARNLRARQRGHLEALHIKVVATKIKRLVATEAGLQYVELENGEQVQCDSMFVNEGHHVNDELLRQLNCRCTKKGAAVTNRQQQTSVPGVYVAGDAAFDMHFVVVAAAEGAKAAVAIHTDLLKADDNLFR